MRKSEDSLFYRTDIYKIISKCISGLRAISVFEIKNTKSSHVRKKTREGDKERNFGQLVESRIEESRNIEEEHIFISTKD